MDSRNQPVEALFEAALALPNPEQRSAYLDRACAGDAALRAEVEGLLRASDQAGGFLGLSADDEPESRGEILEKPGDVIGRYKLLERIGEGGVAKFLKSLQCQVRVILPGSAHLAPVCRRKPIRRGCG